jgi:hypothetical protein
VRYVYFVRGKVHAALAEVSIHSAMLADPAARPIVMTDEPVESLGAILNDMSEVHRFDSAGAPMMLANLDAQCRALAMAPKDVPMVFIDTDTIILQVLPIDARDDLVVTWRDKIGDTEDGKPVVGLAASMPYNYGVIGARANYNALQGFMWMRERIRSLSPTLQHWYGNQVALAALCGPRPEGGESEDKRRIPWTLTSHGDAIRVRKLEGSRYNYTPQMAGERIHGTRSILHFKGGKRKLMQTYAERLQIPWPDALQVKEVAA